MQIIDYFLNTVDISQYDYIVKVSGRYCYDTFDISWFNETNLDHYLVKHPQVFNWVEGFDLIDNRAVDGPVLKQYSSVFYAVGRNQFDHYRQLIAKSMNIAGRELQYHMEALLYFYTRDLGEDKLFCIPLRVIGWDGLESDNRFVCY
jgi:hypothetical protein